MTLLTLVLGCGQADGPGASSLGRAPEADLPSPLWQELSTRTVAARASTGLGGLQRASTLVPVPRVGELLIPEPEAGRVWRQNAFYVVPDAGVWVTQDIREVGGWTPEGCVLTSSGLWQTGDCTGSEIAPEGWTYHHGGFASAPEDIQHGLALEQVVLFTGPGAWVMDASVEDDLGDEHAYSYLQHLRGVQGAPRGARPWGPGLIEDSGQTWRIEGLDSQAPSAVLAERLDLQVLGEGIAWSTNSGFVTPSGTITDLLDCGPPTHLAWDGDRAWAWYERGVLGWTDGEDHGLLSTTELGEVHELLADTVHGQGLAYLLVEGHLHAATTEGLQSEGLELGAPDALAVDPSSHDLYVIEGDQLTSLGSALALEPHWQDPTQIFLAPILETPTDSKVDTDFSWNQAGCEQSVGPEAGCCALEWTVSARVEPNLDYLAALDAAVVLGVNPSVLRQARLCTERGHPAGQALVDALVDARAQGIELTNWTHTPHNDPDPDNPGWFIEQAGGAWEPPVDTQQEYELLHQGLVSVFDQGGLADTPLQAGSGNSVDGNHMDWDGSWVTALRDAPLELGRPALSYSYFGFAGGRLDVGDVSFRKKELFPLDLRLRTHPFELGTSPESWYEGGSSGLIYLPGTTWLVNSLDTLVPSGVWRESLYWGLELSAEDWRLWQLYLRRLIAASDPQQERVQYLHLHDIAHPEMTLEARATQEGPDLNVEALERLEAELPVTWRGLEER